MAACKCRFCKAKLTTAIAYKVEIENKKFYFCSDEHYRKFLLEQNEHKKKQENAQQLKDRFHNLFCEILGVKGITNTALWKEKQEINKVFSDEIIIAYLEENKEWIKVSVGKLSGGEYGKIRYVSTILKNKLGDFKPTQKETPKPKVIVEEVMYEQKRESISTPKSNRRRSLADLEDDY